MKHASATLLKSNNLARVPGNLRLPSLWNSAVIYFSPASQLSYTVHGQSVSALSFGLGDAEQHWQREKKTTLFTYRRVFTVDCNVNNVRSTVGLCVHCSCSSLEARFLSQFFFIFFWLRLVSLHEQRPGFYSGTELQAWRNGGVLSRVRHSLISLILCTIHLDFY